MCRGTKDRAVPLKLLHVQQKGLPGEVGTGEGQGGALQL